jgi:acyl carrier protein
MNKDLILQNLNEIFRDILDNDHINLTEQTTAADVEDWDSLNHIQLIVAIEKKFKIKFTSAEIYQFKNVGEMCDAILKKIN